MATIFNKFLLFVGFALLTHAAYSAAQRKCDCAELLLNFRVLPIPQLFAFGVFRSNLPAHHRAGGHFSAHRRMYCFLPV